MFEKGKEYVAVMGSPPMNPFSGKGDGKIAVNGNGRGWSSHQEGVVALWGRVNDIVKVFGE